MIDNYEELADMDCKKCYGRGYIGMNPKTKKIGNYCKCVIRNYRKKKREKNNEKL